MDFTRHMNRVLEVNQEERWARVEPGVVLDQLKGSVAPMGLQFAPDPSTSDRACVGGSIGNNSCGSHSVVYGKTIDHVEELSTVLSDGSRAHFRAQEGPELEAKLKGSGLESEVYRQVRRIAQENRDEVLARYPKIMRRVSGYNLDEFIGPAGSNGPFNMTPDGGGLRGHPLRGHRGQGEAGASTRQEGPGGAPFPGHGPRPARPPGRYSSMAHPPSS